MKHAGEYYKKMKQLKEEENKAKELWNVIDEIAKESGWYSWIPEDQEISKKSVIRYALAQKLINREEYHLLNEYVR